MDKAMHNTQFPKIMSLMEIHPSLLKRPTELSQMLASKITISQRFWILRNLFKLSILVFPHTEQQYSKIGLIKALYSNFFKLLNLPKIQIQIQIQIAKST